MDTKGLTDREKFGGPLVLMVYHIILGVFFGAGPANFTHTG